VQVRLLSDALMVCLTGGGLIDHGSASHREPLVLLVRHAGRRNTGSSPVWFLWPPGCLVKPRISVEATLHAPDRIGENPSRGSIYGPRGRSNLYIATVDPKGSRGPPNKSSLMKLDLLCHPQISHLTLGVNLPSEAVADFDSTKKKLGDVVNVIQDCFMGAARHFHFTFYFELPPDALTEILCYANLKISRDQKNNDIDCGIMSGSLDDFFMAARIFCRKEVDRAYRGFFNAVLTIIETLGVTLPFSKVDLGDKTYAVKLND
jgi:hypothetical protein